MQLLGERHVTARAKPPDPRRVSRNERFRKYDKARTLFCSLANRGYGLL
jgi:hypothetical protein